MKSLILKRRFKITYNKIIKIPFTMWSVLTGRKTEPIGCYRYKLNTYTYCVIVCLIDDKYYYKLPHKNKAGQDMRKHFGLKRKTLK